MQNEVNLIKSGDNLEIYEYEHGFGGGRGRPRGYKVIFNRADLVNGGGSAIFESKFARRKDNSRRASMAFKRLVQSNLSSSEAPLLITLTFKDNIQEVAQSARFFHSFTVRMRKQFGKLFRYIAVPEFQQRGAVHYHALFWGLPSCVFRQERELRVIAGLWQEGFVDVIETDGNIKLSGYLAKYMVKAIADRRLLFHKAYFASRNVLRPVVGKRIPWWFVEDEYDIASAILLTKKEFLTQWRGKGRYRLFRLNNVN